MPKILSVSALMLLVVLALPAAWADPLATAKNPAVTAEDRVMGKTDAPVALIEYASLTCPHCAAFEENDLPKIKKQWIDTGKVKLIYRDFPLDRFALDAAMIARCAPDKRYFEFIESFFDSQDSWVPATDPLAALKGIARLGGMEPDAVDRCLADKKLQKAVIEMELQAKNDYGVNSTPTFFIIGANGTTKLVGDQPEDAFDKALTAALPKKN
jgi:protein-disulfide isomerase